MSFTPQLFTPSVSLIEGRPATTSLAIAEHFGKRHDHVMRDIAALIANCPEEFHVPNFGEMFRDVEIGNGATRQERFYNVYFDGFMLLVMGYTGKKALSMKLAYISAFNAMRERLERERQSVTNPHELPGGRSTDREMLPFNRLVNEWSRRSGVSRIELLAAVRRQFSLRHANRIPRAILPAVMDYVRQASGLSASKEQPLVRVVAPSCNKELRAAVDIAEAIRLVENIRSRVRREHLPRGYRIGDSRSSSRYELQWDMLRACNSSLGAAVAALCAAAEVGEWA